MVRITAEEMGRDPAGYLRRVEAGETVLVLRDDREVAEIRPAGPVLLPLPRPRRAGLAAGEFVVPDDFDAPLPAEVLDSFEGK